MSGLTSNAAQAALLDAHGLKIREICETVGCGKTSVLRWRKDPEYQAQVDKYREANLEAVDGLLKRYREHLTDAALEAVEALREQLLAVDENGDPMWMIRQEAAEMILKYTGSVVVGAGEASGDEGGLSGVPNVAIIQLGSGEQHGVEPSVRPAAQEVIEGTGVEVA